MTSPVAAFQALVVLGASETLCAFLNGESGKVLVGVGYDGRLASQEVADITLRDIAAMFDHNHSQHRWGNQPALGVCQEDLDHLGLRTDGQTAQLLYGTKFLPNYPQALIKPGSSRLPSRTNRGARSRRILQRTPDVLYSQQQLSHE